MALRSRAVEPIALAPAVRLRDTLDVRFWLVAIAATGATLLLLGLPADLVPNPLFARQVPAEPFAYAVWLVSAPLAGLVAATYLVPVPGDAGRQAALPGRSGPLATLGAAGAFLAVGCPVCNKIALLLLGWSGALTVFGGLQPALGALSVVLLAATLAWRLRTRGRACPVRSPG
jgi:hypothetical protein